MAFYPDELSPIDRVRSLGKQADTLPDISSLKTRRQWKSLVLGKKDMGMNNFATITEEKEEEISSDGSQGANSTKGGAGGLAAGPGAANCKKITFPKPRKYITSRVSERKEETAVRGGGSSVSFASLNAREPPEATPKKAEMLPKSSLAPKLEPKTLPKSGKLKEFVIPAPEFIENFALNETPIETQWNEAFSEGACPQKISAEKVNIAKQEPASQGPQPKSGDKRKFKGTAKASEASKRDAKGGKKKGSSSKGKATAGKEELPSTSAGERATTSRGTRRVDKGKALNMKEVVNVYKNLAYGSKEEIKSFVENLSYVSKDESADENDKNLLPMMNLKALENKIKNFAKKSAKQQDPPQSKEKKPKVQKCAKRNRKAHIERLARHKVVRVPTAPKSPQEVTEPAAQKKKRGVGKEPWKYVGMESILDKTYFVYPAYPKSAAKAKKQSEKGAEKAVKAKKGNADVVAFKASQPETKVKGPQVVLRPNMTPGGGGRSQGLSGSGSASYKNMNRPSAMTVCTVEFQPGAGQKTEEPPAGTSDQSLLLYLHGSKAIHVKSPYSDKQFSRVKFFRKDERGSPLVKGVDRRALPKGRQTVAVRNISLPEKLSRFRPLDLLNFDEDIQNITDFLRSQSSPDRRLQEEYQGIKKSERERWARESPKEQDAATFRQRRRQRRANHELHHQRRDAYRYNMSPDSIISEISRNIHHLQYLPDTEDNRKLIGQFFDELDQRIEATRKGALTYDRFPTTPAPEPFRPIPILGY